MNALLSQNRGNISKDSKQLVFLADNGFVSFVKNGIENLHCDFVFEGDIPCDVLFPEKNEIISVAIAGAVIQDLFERLYVLLVLF